MRRYTRDDWVHWSFCTFGKDMYTWALVHRLAAKASEDGWSELGLTELAGDLEISPRRLYRILTHLERDAFIRTAQPSPGRFLVHLAPGWPPEVIEVHIEHAREVMRNGYRSFH